MNAFREGRRKTSDLRNGAPWYARLTGRNVLNLKQKLRTRKFWMWVALVALATAALFFIIKGHPTQADVKDFYPQVCLGDWQNPQYAERQAETVLDTSASFSAEDSAFDTPSSTQILCDNFLPDTFATSSVITSAAITFIWQVGDAAPTSTIITPPDAAASVATGTDVDAGNDGGTVASTSVDTGTSTSTSTDMATDTSDTDETMNAASTTDTGGGADTGNTSGTSGTSDLGDEGDASDAGVAATTTMPTPTPTVIPSATPTPTTTTTTTTTLTPTPTPTPTPIPTGISPDDSDSGATTTDASGDDGGTSLISPARFMAFLFPSARADDQSEDSSTIDATTTDAPLDLSSDDGGASSTEPTSTNSTDIVPAVSSSSTDDSILLVSYSTDGQLWVDLQEVDASNWENLTLALPVTNWDDLKNLQVRIENIGSSTAPMPPVYLDGVLLEVHYDDPSGVPNDSALYKHFSMTSAEYTMGDQIAVTAAPPESYIEIYQFDDPNNPDAPSNDYAIQVDNTGATTIDTNTLSPGKYLLVNTYEPGACNEYTVAECRARQDYIAETEITVDPAPFNSD